ncbi:hypothetical protein COU56_00735 [Candidatus Pacearchaeota archaeon CG10_big_fil_rev_8_21_14_0_10_31_9]|nr:MAG: hypothetical protein AUJ62_00620 [Candidatus Pacearchaeota archaeon CG1_02_32_21]PIN95707.1 MAG: hypothetical protein COU56_00735 [Candidatus Pacearchaeota archaeon CG10_big_fil_rev_8_21_14_0_10_31_9]PIZ82573.1 MAG: hypothetical protein COX97_04060 [Candidatus Pacearchaeota archaeon CG_4_10_14_0_2_um_filter_05_32_18]
MFYNLIKKLIDKEKDNDYYFTIIEEIFSKTGYIKGLGRSKIPESFCNWESQNYHILEDGHSCVVILRRENGNDEIQVSILLPNKEDSNEDGERLTKSIEERVK